MAVFKCKMCGGTLNVHSGETVCECEYCGTKQTVPALDNDKKITLFNRANRLRSAGEFDKAAGIYESIVAEFDEEAEAYWGLVLCKYGIEYVDDPETGEKIPTCHRSSFDSVMEDPNFELVMEYSDPASRALYRAEAKEIERIREGIIEVSAKEEPYDIFICYKEEDENGDRTTDSVIAQDVYDALTEKGYRVFFSRISLEDKLGEEYEPYIFAALNSAKVMLAFGTDYEYYNAPWVKNEWSRYLKLIENGGKKTLIPCYKDIDAYDMPKEFKRLQAQDMGKVGAVQDLLRGIDKIFGKGKPGQTEQQPATAAVSNSNVDALLKRVSLFMEDEDWEKADDYCEQVLDIDPENALAYTYKCCIEFQCHGLSEIAEKVPAEDTDRILSSPNFKKAQRYSEGSLKLDIEQTLKKIQEKKESRIKHLKFLRDRASAVSKLVSIDTISAGIRADGTVVLGGIGYSRQEWKDELHWTDIVSVYSNGYQVFGVRSNGTVVEKSFSANGYDVKDWQYIVSIDGNPSYNGGVIGLRSTRRLVTKGRDPRLAELNRWSDIVAVSADRSNRYAGLKTNGTVVVSGCGFDVSDWTDIISILIKNDHLIGLRSDGTVAAAGGNQYGVCNVREWKDIVQIACSYKTTVGLKSDGTVVATGNNASKQCDVQDWQGVVAIGAGDDFTIGLKSDGTVIMAGFTGLNFDSDKKIKGWRNIVALIANNYFIVGIKADGTAVSVSDNADDQLDLSGWKLFNDISTLEEERKRNKEALEEKRRENRLRSEEERRKNIAALEQERGTLSREASEVNGFFAERKRKKINDRISEIDKELKTLTSEL